MGNKKKKKALSNTKKTEFGNKIAPFYRMGQATYKLLFRINIMNRYFKKMGDNLKIIYPKYREEEITEMYISYKLMGVYAFLTAGILLFTVYSFVISDNNEITKLARQNYWGENEEHQIIAKTDNMERTIDVTVSHQEISDETMQLILEEKAEELPQLILGGNKSTDMVNKDLNLISQIPDTLIDVYWEVEDNEVLLSDGTVVVENIKDEENLVCLYATLCYGDVRSEIQFYVNVIKSELSGEEKTQMDLRKEIKRVDSSTVSEESLTLPKEIGGKTVTYMRRKEIESRWIFAIMFLICIPLLFFVQDEKLEKKKIKRENQMLIDYPEIINKLILYLGAGLTIQGAFEMISKNYLQGKGKKKSDERFAYEEIVFLHRSIQGGVTLPNALEHFGVRCGVLPFRKLSMLLLQNLRKGSIEMVGLLRHEAVSAFDMRKNAAKKLGEEAGTKMLFPMIMSLGVVLVILIVPAWISFQI